MTSASGPRACAIRAPWHPCNGVPMVAAAGGTMTRRLRSTASSRGSRIRLAGPASRSGAGSSAGGTEVEGGGAVVGSGMRPRPSVIPGGPVGGGAQGGAARPSLPADCRRIRGGSALPPVLEHGRRCGVPSAAGQGRVRRLRMALKIMPHGRLQEWVADERGFFTAEGLEYSFLAEGDYGVNAVGRDDSGEIKSGAFETFEAGRDGADVSFACHWATSAAASERTGQLVTAAYSVAPCGIMVPPDSAVRRPEDLAGIAVGVGYHSGSHFAT